MKTKTTKPCKAPTLKLANDMLMRADGSISTIAPEDGKSYHLPELYRALGCNLVEVVVTRFPGFILICDEEALYADPQYNHRASLAVGTEIYGDAILCPDRHFR